MKPFFGDLFNRLQELHSYVEKAIHRLPQEALDWVPWPDVNSLSVLVVHLAGAERYWIGDVVGLDPSGRDRSAEFQVKGLTSEALKERLRATLTHSRQVLETLSLEDLETTFVSPRDGHRFTAGWALAHALEHTAIHAGQAKIIRQLWDQSQKG